MNANHLDILNFRRARGWSQAALAEKLGVQQSTICRWETGTPPKPYILIALERIAETYPAEEAVE